MTTPVGPRGGTRETIALATLLVALSLVLFRPWVSRPFDVLDFSEFLPFLTGNAGAWGRFVAFVRYYAGEHGRLNVLSYAGLVAKWSVLGASPVLWQWARVLEMGLVVAGFYALARRLALRPAPALAAASLFVASRLSSEAWFRMTMGEPLGLLLALGALLLATTWRDHPKEVWRVVSAGVLMALAILAKEMLIGLLPIVWFVGIARDADGWLTRPTFGPEQRRLMALSGLLPLLAFCAVALVATNGGNGGFTDLYGRNPTRFLRLLDLLPRPWILQGERGGVMAFSLPGNALFLAILIAGWWAEARHPERRRHALGVLGIALALTVTFACLYLPWPYTYHYYAIPFFLGPALLFGMAVQTLADEGPTPARVTAGAHLLLILLIAPGTAEATSVTIAMQQVNGELAGTLGIAPRATRIIVARTRPPPQAWMGTAATLRRYALATGIARSLPPGLDLTCQDANEVLQHPLGGTIFITYRAVCGSLPDPSVHVAHTYRVVGVSWSGIAISDDSIAADVLIGLDGMNPPPPRK
jgi:hypothetical protein